jgi:hypothetical protein
MESVLVGREVPESSKLQGAQNYAIWAFKVCPVLQKERVWAIVNPDDSSSTSSGAPDSETRSTQSAAYSGATTTPARAFVSTNTGGALNLPSNPSATTQIDAPAVAATSPSFSIEDQRYRAIGIIVPTLKDSLVPHIMNLQDPMLVWIKFRDLFESTSMNRRMSIKSQLYNLKMSEKTSVEEHLCTVSSLIAQLANIGTIVPDEELVDRVLTSL